MTPKEEVCPLTLKEGLSLKKHIAIFFLILMFINSLCSCEFIKKPLDNKIGFSKCLMETESFIRSEEWENAQVSLENATKAWKKIRPILQVDIDHDYVNDIENNFISLKAFIETREKPDSLSLILLIQQDWETIGEM